MMRVGIGQADISPTVGIPGRLGIQHRLGDGGHPIRAQAVWFGTDNPVVQITCEIVGLTGSFRDKVHAALESALGLPADRVVITGTHTHCSPWVWELQADAFAGWGYDVFDRAWERTVIDGCVAAAQAARDTAEPAILSVGSGLVRGVASNRVQFGPRWSIVRDPAMREKPDGAIDPMVRVLVISTPEGKIRQLVANYACHPSGFGGGKTEFASPDFPWFAETELRNRYGAQLSLTYWMGCSGNINAGKYVAEGSIAEVRALGRRLAEGISAAIESAVRLESPESDGEAQIRHVDQRYEPGEWLPDAGTARREFDTVAERVAQLLDRREIVEPELVGEWRSLVKRYDAASLVVDGAIPARISCIDIDGAQFLFLPGEWYHSYGMGFAARREHPVFTTTLSTIDLLYMPDEDSMPHRDWYGVSPRMRTVSDDGVRMLAAEADRLLG